jgi:hypothetical protein
MTKKKPTARPDYDASAAAFGHNRKPQPGLVRPRPAVLTGRQGRRRRTVSALR